jgi:hypothetical protein
MFFDGRQGMVESGVALDAATCQFFTRRDAYAVICRYDSSAFRRNETERHYAGFFGSIGPRPCH